MSHAEDGSAKGGAPHQSPETTRVLEFLLRALQDVEVPPAVPEDLSCLPGLKKFYALVLDMRGFLMGLSQGNLQQKLNHKGYLPGVLKTFQSNLSHLTWQTQMIAEGDFSQRVDFLGEFSQAFNSMVMRLSDSIEALRESELKFRTVADFTNDWEYWVDSGGRFLWVSPACARLTGYQPEDFIANPLLLHTLVHPDDRAVFQAHYADISRSDTPHCDMDFRVQDRAGREYWVQHTCHPVFSPDGAYLGRRGCNRDITARKDLEEELKRLAATDPLTGISNRRNFLQRAEDELRRSERFRLPLSLLMLDIDKFKSINDSFGHAMGDAAIKAVVAACQKNLRQVDIFGRLGGEEFAALLPQTDENGAVAMAERMRRAVEGIELPTEDTPLRMSISLGLAELRRGEGIDELMRRADAALYRSKELGRNRTCVCDAGDDAKA